MSPSVTTEWIANLSRISLGFQGKVKQHFLEGMPQLRFKHYQYIVKYCLLLILQVEGCSRLVAPVGELVEEHQLSHLSQDSNGKRKIELSYVAWSGNPAGEIGLQWRKRTLRNGKLITGAKYQQYSFLKTLSNKEKFWWNVPISYYYFNCQCWQNWLYSIINHANLEDAGQVAAGDVDAHVRLVLPLHLARQQHLQGLLNNYFVFILDWTFEPVPSISTRRHSLASVRFTLYNPKHSQTSGQTFN